MAGFVLLGNIGDVLSLLFLVQQKSYHDLAPLGLLTYHKHFPPKTSFLKLGCVS